MDGPQICEIRPDGIEYVDDDGQLQYIDFATCHENYMKHFTSSDYRERMKTLNKLTDDEIDEHVERVRAVKMVGARNILGRPVRDGPYIEFYTQPPVRFDFQTEDSYYEVLINIHKLGLRTEDLS